MHYGDEPAVAFTHESAVVNDIRFGGRVHSLFVEIQRATVLVRVVAQKSQRLIFSGVGNEELEGLWNVFLLDDFWCPCGQRDREHL